MSFSAKKVSRKVKRCQRPLVNGKTSVFFYLRVYSSRHATHAKGRVMLVRLTNIFIILNTDGRNITFIQ